MHLKFVNVNGVPTRYLFEGEGYPLLLIHGGGIACESWFRNIDPLGEHFQVVAPDLPYHGSNGLVEYKGGSPYEHMVDHLVNFLDAVGIDKLAAAGSSLGALLAANLYFKIPDRVERLILIGSGSSFNTPEQITTTRGQSLQNAMSAISNPTFESCHKRLGNICYDPSVVPHEIILSEMTDYATPGFAENHEKARRAMMEPEHVGSSSILDRLGQIAVPTVVITGREDPRAVYASTVEGVKKIPNASLVTVEKCGHLPYVEHPEQFHETVLEFMKIAV